MARSYLELRKNPSLQIKIKQTKKRKQKTNCLIKFKKSNLFSFNDI